MSLGQSPEDDLLLQVQGIVSEYQRAKIMERSRRGKKHAAQSGSLNVMSGAPFGYRYVSVREGEGQARFEPVAEQARVVQQIFSWIGRDRCSLAEVCRRLHKASTPTATGPGGIRKNTHDASGKEFPAAGSTWTPDGTAADQGAKTSGPKGMGICCRSRSGR